MSFVLALPSKGRLREEMGYIWEALGVVMGVRDYMGALEGVPGVQVVAMPAAAVAAALGAGKVHMGLTGLDLLEEEGGGVLVGGKLGLGGADVVVAVPRGWLDVERMRHMEEVGLSEKRMLRVATKYPNLTRRFFAGCGVGLYRVVGSMGATEAAPAAGSADVVVDIARTGETLRANGLKVLEDGLILASEVVVGMARGVWAGEDEGRARVVMERLAGVVGGLTEGFEEVWHGR